MKIQITVQEAKGLIATMAQARAAVIKENRGLADCLDLLIDLLMRRIETSEVSNDGLEPGLQGRNFNKN